MPSRWGASSIKEASMQTTKLHASPRAKTAIAAVVAAAIGGYVTLFPASRPSMTILHSLRSL
jgi:hypothetical protein